MIWRLNHYSNGGSVLHLGAPNHTLEAMPSNDLNKRFQAPEFKISFKTGVKSQLSKQQADGMDDAVAKDWQQRSSQISDYIGFVENDQKRTANYFYRIIPEVEGFGLNYEDLETCGRLSDLL